jgi:AraC family transcriptional regulator
LELLHKNIAVSDVFLKYGFADNSTFTRTFKNFYGVSPTEFKKQNPNRFSKIRQLDSKNGQTYPDNDQYICAINNLKNWIQMNAKIEIREIQKMELAGVPAMGHNNIAAAYQKLMRWAAPMGLLNANTKMLTVYHDSFKITEADKVRTEACIVLNQPVKPSGEVKLSTIAKGKFIVGSYEIILDDFENAWTGLFIWMNENRNIFELYHNNFNDHPEKKAIVDFYVPIE